MVFIDASRDFEAGKNQNLLREADLQRIVELGKTLLQHPVELLPDVRDAVLANAPAPEHGFLGVPKVIE